MKKSIKNTLISSALIFLFLAMLSHPDKTLEAARTGMQIAAHDVIPALFPFAVISSLGVAVLSSGNIKKRGALALFPVLIGFLCGFPLGAKTALELHSKGMLSKRELKLLLPLSNNTGPAFIIGAAGISMFSSKEAGVLLYLCQLASALISALVFWRFTAPSDVSAATQKEQCKSEPFSKEIPRAITSSAVSMLTIGGFVTFFYVFLSTLSSVLIKPGVNENIRIFLSVIFEMSCGVSDSAALSGISPALSLALAAFAISWAGISVHLQVALILPEKYRHFGFYIAFKAFQALIAALLAFIFAPVILPLSFTVAALSARAVSHTSAFLALFLVLIFILKYKYT